MSFSSDIKETLCKASLTRSKNCENCRKACLAGILEFAGKENGGKIHFGTSNEYVADYITDTFSLCGVTVKYIKNARGCQFVLNTDDPAAKTIKNWEASASGCCRRAFLRGAFLGGGSVTDPHRAYHMEFCTRSEEQARRLTEILASCGAYARQTFRKGFFTVYLKECEAIADTLNFMGAANGGLEFFNVQIEKEMRNSINRRVNCETANADKMARTASRQIMAIREIKKRGKWGTLSEPLRQIGEVREQYPDMSLKELGLKLSEPLGKSGVNHRLNKIIKIAEELR